VFFVAYYMCLQYLYRIYCSRFLNLA